MDLALGMTPYRTMTYDALHLLYLGVFQTWGKHALWMILRSPIWVAHETTREEHLSLTIVNFRAALQNFYKARAATHPGEDLTRINDITLKMIGTSARPNFRFSGGETWGLLLFMLHVLRQHDGAIGGNARRVLEAGDLLETYLNLARSQPMNIPRDVLQEQLTNSGYTTPNQHRSNCKAQTGCTHVCTALHQGRRHDP